MRLDLFHNTNFVRGASRPKEALWLLVSGLLVESWLPGSAWRVALLRVFGAQMGAAVVIKPCVKIKFPWRLCVGDYSWIGERAWIDNLANVTIGDHVCISQDVYLCTGSHDWSSEGFDLIFKTIVVESYAWLGAKSIIGPGCEAGEGSVVTLGSVVSGRLEPWTIYTGAPAKPIRQRSRSQASSIES